MPKQPAKKSLADRVQKIENDRACEKHGHVFPISFTARAIPNRSRTIEFCRKCDRCGQEYISRISGYVQLGANEYRPRRRWFGLRKPKASAPQETLFHRLGWVSD